MEFFNEHESHESHEPSARRSQFNKRRTERGRKNSLDWLRRAKGSLDSWSKKKRLPNPLPKAWERWM